MYYKNSWGGGGNPRVPLPLIETLQPNIPERVNSQFVRGQHLHDISAIAIVEVEQQVILISIQRDRSQLK